MTTRSQHRASRRLPAWGTSAPARFGVAVLSIFALVFAGYGVAFAFDTSTGSDSATATTGTLNPPTAVSGAQVTHTSSVNVSWTAPVGGATPTGYYVLRTPSPSGTTVAACGTSAAAPTGSTSCLDTLVPNGNYTYVVVAVHYSWTATSAPSAVVTVVETTQTITFTSSPSSPTVNGTYVVTATGGGSGNPVIFSSATPSVCTVIASSVTFVGAGTCTINANQAGNAQYNPAPQVQQTFTVAKAPQTITYTTAAPVGAVVGGPGYTPAATGGGSGNAVVFSIDASTATNCSISAGVVTYQHVGSCTVNADQAGNANYLAANTAQQSYAIGKGSQAIAFTSTAPVNAKVGGLTYTVTATGGASGNAVTFSSGSPAVCTVVGSTVSFVGAGTCLVNANQAGNADYLAATQVQQSFNVTKQDQTITFTSTAPSNAKNQGATYNVTATASSGQTVVLTVDASASSVCALSGSTVSFIGAGTCVINANQAGNGTYNAAPQAQQTFAVAKGDQTISFTSTAPVSATNQGATYNVTATASSGLTVVLTVDASASSVCALSGSTVSFIGAGTCVINANQTGNGNFNAAPQVAQSFAVAKANQTITFTPVLTATAPSSATLTASSSAGLTPITFSTTSLASICTVSGTTVNYVGAGTCNLVASQAGNANYNPGSASAAIVVTAGDVNGPTIVITDPTHATNGLDWGAGACGTGSNDNRICANVSDPSGVASVSVTLRRASDGKYYDGSGLNESDWLAAPTTLPMTLNGAPQYRSAGLLDRNYADDDTYTITVTASDTLANTNTATSAYIIDNINPTASISPTAPGYTNTGVVTITGVDLNAVTISYRIDSDVAAFQTFTGNPFVTTLGAGTHTVDYFATDASGRVSATVNNAPIIVDLTAPSAPAITDISNDTGSSAADNITNNSAQQLSGTGEVGATVTVTRTVGTSTPTTCTATVSGGGTWLCAAVITLSFGVNSWTATQADLAGNVSVASGTFSATYENSGPSVPIIEPATETGAWASGISCSASGLGSRICVQATDGSGVAGVTVQLIKGANGGSASDDFCWNGNAGGTNTFGNAGANGNVANCAAQSMTYNASPDRWAPTNSLTVVAGFAGANFVTGTYTLRIVVTDVAGNTSTFVRTFGVTGA